MSTETARMTPIPLISRLWRSDKRYRVAYGGRGSGKSYGVAQYLVSKALSEEPMRILCTKETQNSLSDSALAIIKRVIKDHGLDAYFRATKHGLQSIFGTEFIFRGLQHPDRIKSLDDILIAWVEEAHSVTSEAWDVLTPTIRADDSEIWVTFNPDGVDDPVYQRFVIRGRDDSEVVKINYGDNEYFPDVLRREMEWDKAHDFDKYLHVWEGEPRSISDAQVFYGKWRTDTFATPENAEFYYGADWGFSQDPSVLVRCFVKDEALYIDHEAYGVGVDIVDTPALFDRVPGAKQWAITADSARPETIHHMQNVGYRMRPAQKAKGSVEDGIAFLRSFREIVIHERCKHTADEFKLYSYKRDRLTGEILPVLEDKHNHCIDALRYALEQAMLRFGRPAVSITQRIW